MNSLLQQKDYLIGSKKDIQALKSKDHARVLVVSDVHGKSSILLNIVKQFGKSCDALVLCGDCIYDLAELLEQGSENKDFCQLIPPIIGFVQGNGDPSTFPVSFDIGLLHRFYVLSCPYGEPECHQSNGPERSLSETGDC